MVDGTPSFDLQGRPVPIGTLKTVSDIKSVNSGVEVSYTKNNLLFGLLYNLTSTTLGDDTVNV